MIAGFSPNATAHLDIKFGTNTIDPPGKSLTKARKSNHKFRIGVEMSYLTSL